MNAMLDRMPLPPRTVHVWRVATQVAPDARPPLPLVLGAEERRRLERMRSPNERRRRLVAWVRRREILARYLGCGPAEIVFVRDEQGRPSIAAPAGHGLQFSLSHTGEVALIGVSRQAIGVDIERTDRSLAPQRLADRFFDPEAAAWLERLAAPDRTEAVLRLWVLKEAVLKAVGGKVPSGLSSCRIRFDGLVPVLDSWTGAKSSAVMHLANLPVPDGYCAAVAVACSNPRVVVMGEGWSATR